NRVNGVYSSENPDLLKRQLKEGWQFDGLVISDWFGTYSDKVPAGGLDLEMPGPGRWMGEECVRKALADGSLTEAELDDRVCRLFRLMERVGTFADPVLHEERAENTAKQRALIRKTAQDTIVLLKNEGNLLPLNPAKVKKIAVIGELAERPNVMGGGSSRVNPHYVVSPLEGIRARFGKSAKVEYATGCIVNRRLPLFDPKRLMSDTGKAGGLTLRLYDNPDFAGKPAYEIVTDRFNFDWWGPGVPNVDPRRFTARLSGTFTASTDGAHSFSLTTVGRGRLVLGGEVLIDNWDGQRINDEQTAQKTLSAGQQIRIQADFRWEGADNWRYLRLGYLPPMADDPVAEAVALAQKADAVIVVAGLTNEWESESYDRLDMNLPRKQDELIESIRGANPHTIVVLNAGSPVTMPWAEKVPVIVEQWYNSQECGHALADVLSGDVNPSGKLPTTFPKKYEDNPTFGTYPGKDGKLEYREGLLVGYRYYDTKGIEPLFPFGHGLSYTRFEYSNLKVSRTKFGGKDALVVSLDVKNAGRRAGKEVIQLYVHDDQAAHGRPEQELKAFQKVELEPGQSRAIRYDLGGEAFWHYSVEAGGWTMEPGVYEIRVGGSSRDLPLRTRVTMLKSEA
ncbi:MAG TPA: glycoside hydrolase family 3 C-terminal domain-containing protein, partial [Anaerolineales bacterium]|nr:glycoside hydrolase family 3 C-terminal domain-containing protein [Anaerolineales bacterium]